MSSLYCKPPLHVQQPGNSMANNERGHLPKLNPKTLMREDMCLN